MPSSTRHSGFTLVELAIVLVIIGLLVGGVLVGQDLIRAAEINSTSSQITKYDSAANTFRTKYNGYPGDVRNPANYPLAATGANGTPGRANGDGVIQSSGTGTCTNAYGFGAESALFWTHLAQSNLITDATTGMTSYTAVAAINPIDDGDMPQARLGNGNRFHVTSDGGRNYYVLANFTQTTITTCALTATDALTPQQAFQMDSKMDDGNAATGLIVSVLDGAAPNAVGGGSAAPDATGTDDCYNSTTGAYATTTSALSAAMQCQLRIRTSF